MARPKTQESEPETVTVNITDFKRSRDAVIVALAALSSAVKDLSKAYLNHQSVILHSGENDAGALDLEQLTTLLESGLLGHHASSGMMLDLPIGEKKKRKRVTHDPNAPKKPLTAYFLYMKTARPQIAAELGPDARPSKVAEEGTRRWTTMATADQNVWKAEYAKHMAVYYVKRDAYKAGKPIPSDEEAKEILRARGSEAEIPLDGELETGEEEDDDDEEDEEAATTEEDSEEESSPEPVQAVSPPKSSKRRKTDEKQTVTPARSTPVAPVATKASSGDKDKKHKKSRKEPTPPPPSKSEKKKKSKKAA